MALVPWGGRAAQPPAPSSLLPDRSAGLPVPAQAATPAPGNTPADLVLGRRAVSVPAQTAAAVSPLATLAARAGVPVPIASPDPLGPVTPAGRLVKGKVELGMSGGSEPGALGIAAWAGPGSWSDDRLFFQRRHFIPVALGGLQSVNLGALGPGGAAQIPEPKRMFMGGPALVPLVGLNKAEFSNELSAVRLPYSTGVPVQQFDLPASTTRLGGPYAPGTAGVLPAEGTDPYGSLPDFLRAPLLGQPAGAPGRP